MQKIPHEEYFRTLPKKRMASAVLFFDESKNILIVKPSYKEGWIVPGGVIEENESPKSAALREVMEEIGLTIYDLKLVCVDYKKAMDEIISESIQFVFYGGVLSTKQVKNIKLEEGELSDFRFVSIDEALKLLRSGLKGRLPASLDAIDHGSVAYLES